MQKQPPSPYIVWRRIAVGFAVLAIGTVLYLSDVLTPFFIAFGLAYAFNPIVGYLEKKKIPRRWGSAIVTSALLLLGALLITSIIPVLIRDGTQFVSDFPDFVSRALERIAQVGERFGIAVPEKENLISKIRGVAGQTGKDAVGSLGTLTQRVFAGAGLVVASIIQLLIIPIFFYLLLYSFPHFLKNFLSLIPRRHQEATRAMMEKIDRVCAGFIRGQLLVAFILACVFSIGLSIIGVRYGFVIGILAGFLNIIPYVGQLMAVCLSVLMLLVDFPGWGPVIATLVFFMATNFLEGNFLSPKIVGDKVGLTMLQAILALLVGAHLGGVAGMILALPTAGSLKVLFVEIFDHYRRSEFYKESDT